MFYEQIKAQDVNFPYTSQTPVYVKFPLLEKIGTFEHFISKSS